MLLAGPLGTAEASSAYSLPVAVFPIPGGRVAAPATQITIRGVPSGAVGTIVVTGSASGAHAGTLAADSDGDGASFIPTAPFKAGETVTVQTGLNVFGGNQGSWSFSVAAPAPPIRGGAFPPGPRVPGDVWHFASRRDLAPASVRVTRGPSSGAAPGDVFVASQSGPEQIGPELVGPHGGLIYFKSVPHGDSATDFREQLYRGKPVLTWWQGTLGAAGVGAGEDEIYDSDYRPVATVKAGNGLAADLHEFQLTPQSNALITAYYPVFWDTSAVKGGSKHEAVLDSVVQEIDIPTGLVLFQWDSLDHVPVTASELPPPTVAGQPFDYFHVNSAGELGDGSVLISARNTWAGYDLNHGTGAVAWTLGGKRSSFKLGAGASFAFQHDIRMPAPGVITLFDDGAGPPVVHRQSRGLTLALNLTALTATVVRQDEHQPALLAAFEGNAQREANGDDFVGWGQQPEFTEFDPLGHEVFDARFVGNSDTYRAYRFPWSGTPVTAPAVAARTSGGRTTVYASWNGATLLAKWRILAGSSPAALAAVATVAKGGFETATRLAHRYAFVQAQALDTDGRVLGSSATIK